MTVPAAAMHPAAGTICDLCGSSASRRFWRDDVVQCTSCGLVRAAAGHFQIEPASLYDASYFSGAEYVDYRGDRQAARVNGRRRVRLLRTLAPAARSLFEIGAGYGYFLELAAEQWSAAGIEVSAHAAAEAKRLGVRCACGDYLTAAPHPSDIVCLWDTVEHLQSPRAVLTKAARELTAGGVIAISTGDVEGWLPRLQKDRWRLLHPPTHLWYFSLATLSALLRDSGFEVVRMTRPLFYRSLRLYSPALARALPRAVGDLPVPLQTGDLIEVYARRTAARI